VLSVANQDEDNQPLVSSSQHLRSSASSVEAGMQAGRHHPQMTQMLADGEN